MVFLVIIALAILWIVLVRRKEKNKRERLGVPKGAYKIHYYNGYDKQMSHKLYYWKDNNSLNFCDTVEKNGPIHITIPKECVLSFTSTGELSTQTNVSGGGVSLGGAAVGGVLLGPVGAIIGGRKKVKTKTSTTDSRRTIIRFTENGMDKSIMLTYPIYNDLCLLCMEKKV